MPRVKFDYDSKALVDVWGEETASNYLNLASKTLRRAAIVRIYGLTLMVVSVLLLLLIGFTFIEINSLERTELLRNEQLWKVLLSIIPFTILGTYLWYSATRVLKAAKEQVSTIESSIMRFEREANG